MADANLLGGFLGGTLIGLAAALLLLLNGRIAGIAGILAGLLTIPRSHEWFWRAAFIAGLIGGTAIHQHFYGATPTSPTANNFTLVLAGLLVGFGTRLGSGCTSGHGVCGLARRSPRSLVATGTFIVSGILTVYLVKQLF